MDSLVKKLKGTKTCEFVLTGLGTLLMASLKQYFCTAVTNYPMSSSMGRVFGLSVNLFVYFVHHSLASAGVVGLPLQGLICLREDGSCAINRLVFLDSAFESNHLEAQKSLFLELPCKKLQLSLCEWFSVVNTLQYHQKL